MKLYTNLSNKLWKTEELNKKSSNLKNFWFGEREGGKGGKGKEEKKKRRENYRREKLQNKKIRGSKPKSMKRQFKY